MVQVISPKGAKPTPSKSGNDSLKKREKNEKRPKPERVKNAKGTYVFAKGNSGGGRPLGSKGNTLTTILKQALEETQFNTPTGEKINAARALIDAIVIRGIKKSDTAAEMIFNRVDGKITDKADDEKEVREIKITIHHKK